MSEEQTNLQREAQQAVENNRSTLDAIAEDLVMGEAPKPAPTKPTPTRDDRGRFRGDDVEEDDVSVEDVIARARKAPPESVEDPDDELAADDGEDGEDYDFFDDLLKGEAEGEDADAAATSADDEQRFTVKVDGEEVEVTLAQLKQRFSAEGAIDKRLQEATEQRNRAIQEGRQLVDQEVAQVRDLSQRLRYVFENYAETLLKPQVEAPDPKMRDYDPVGYSLQMQDYQADQQRLQRDYATMQQQLEQARQIEDQQAAYYTQQQAQALRQKLPALADPKKADQFKRAVAEIAIAHGFTPEEISSARDHRIFTLAAEAAAYRDLKKRLGSKQAKPVKMRPMPSRGDNRQKGETQRGAAKARKVMAKARETGSVDDVAATLLL